MKVRFCSYDQNTERGIEINQSEIRKHYSDCGDKSMGGLSLKTIDGDVRRLKSGAWAI